MLPVIVPPAPHRQVTALPFPPPVATTSDALVARVTSAAIAAKQLVEARARTGKARLADQRQSVANVVETMLGLYRARVEIRFGEAIAELDHADWDASYDRAMTRLWTRYDALCIALRTDLKRRASQLDGVARIAGDVVAIEVTDALRRGARDFLDAERARKPQLIEKSKQAVRAAVHRERAALLRQIEQRRDQAYRLLAQRYDEAIAAIDDELSRAVDTIVVAEYAITDALESAVPGVDGDAVAGAVDALCTRLHLTSIVATGAMSRVADLDDAADAVGDHVSTLHGAVQTSLCIQPAIAEHVDAYATGMRSRIDAFETRELSMVRTAFEGAVLQRVFDA